MKSNYLKNNYKFNMNIISKKICFNINYRLMKNLKTKIKRYIKNLNKIKLINFINKQNNNMIIF
jgi:hypothetical protein